MKSIVKVQWKKKKNNKWQAQLMLASKQGFEKRGLQKGRQISLEILNERRCTGYAPSPGERASCPEFRKINSGSQCGECRGKDIYSDYVRGSKNDLEGDFSVYYAQIGSQLKVGVTRSENIPKRWIEQGADYATEIHKDLSSNKALEKEKQLTNGNVSQRIRKENKMNKQKPELLKNLLKQKEIDSEIIDVQKLTAYPEIDGSFKRKGLLEGKIKTVKGQIISNGRVAMALTSGKAVNKPSQKALNKF